MQQLHRMLKYLVPLLLLLSPPCIHVEHMYYPSEASPRSTVFNSQPDNTICIFLFVRAVWYTFVHMPQNGICGLRNMDGDIDWDDPKLVDFNVTDRSNCSSIADNKLHGTYPDALIGPTQTVLVSKLRIGEGLDYEVVYSWCWVVRQKQLIYVAACERLQIELKLIGQTTNQPSLSLSLLLWVTQTRRSKYVAVSRLTGDLMESSTL